MSKALIAVRQNKPVMQQTTMQYMNLNFLMQFSNPSLSVMNKALIHS